MTVSGWFSDNFIEIFGAVTGILYVILEIRQNIWLWPVGIITSGIYIWVFFTGKLYADMSLQGYYLVISVLGWYWWVKGTRLRAQGSGQKGGKGDEETEGLRDEGTKRLRDEGTERLEVSRLKLNTGIALSVIFVLLFTVMWLVLDRLTDSPVPGWDSFITSLSIIATWMLARKIYEHWFLWIVVNAASVILFLTRGLYPTVLLYIVYCSMSFVGLRAWKRTIQER
ncbi:MAG: nicotinamide riboside transporter PnuC [Bacteroidales bacterium]|nr:nicotinamide riboside transporter PnuC [Bacteroidales bacterium]